MKEKGIRVNGFPLLDDAEVHDPRVADVYAEIRRDLGFGIVPNIFKSMAVRPPYLRAMWDLFRSTILEGQLPRALKEMLGVLISQENDSEYTMKVHLHSLSTQGVADEVLSMLVRDFDHCPLPEREKLVLRFGLLSATDPLQLTETDYQHLREHDLTDEEIFEVIATATLFAAINAYTDTLGVPVDQLG